MQTTELKSVQLFKICATFLKFLRLRITPSQKQLRRMTPKVVKELKNVQLTKGQCSVCLGPIEKDWAGENPSLGTVCRNCSDKRDSVFGPDNVEIQVQKHLRFKPVLNIYEYDFDWKGTRIMVNGKVGVISSPQGDGDFVRFEGDKSRTFGTFIKGVGYYDLMRIYKAQGGEVQPPPLQFGEYKPTKVELLSEPILPVHVDMDNGNVRSIQVGRKSVHGGLMFTDTELPNLSMLHAFANIYVRYKFGLAANYCAEGGFMGNDFEVRNAGMFTGGVGLTVRMDRLANDLKYVNTPNSFRNLAVQENLLGLIAEREQSRPGVIKNAGAEEVLATWVAIMVTLLMYDWSKLPYETIGDVWTHYCRMQDVLLNFMTVEELSEVLAYHSGKKY